MSLILDALNKADRQRDDQEPVPNLTTYHVAPSKPKPVAGIASWMLYSILALLVLVVIGLALLLLQGRGERGPASVVSASTATTEVADKPKPEPIAIVEAVAPPAVATGLNAPIKGLRTEDGSPRGGSVPSDRREPAISAEVAAIYGQVGDTGVTAPKRDVVDGLYQSEKASAPRKTAQASPKKPVNPLVDDQELQALWEQSQAEGAALTPPVIDPYAKLPYLHQLPESFQNRIPTLMYHNHIFSAKASAVILNGKTYRKGEEIATSLVVEAITEEDLILSYLNKPFRLAALSSWVKMD